MSDQQTTKQPSHSVYTVIEREGNRQNKWLEIGAAWETRDGEGYTIQLDALPIDNRLVLRAR